MRGHRSQHFFFLTPVFNVSRIGVFSSSGMGSPVSKADNDSSLTEPSGKAQAATTPLIYQHTLIEEMFQKIPSVEKKRQQQTSAPVIEALHIDRIELNNEPIRLEEKSFEAAYVRDEEAGVGEEEPREQVESRER